MCHSKREKKMGLAEVGKAEFSFLEEGGGKGERGAGRLPVPPWFANIAKEALHCHLTAAGQTRKERSSL